MRKIFGALVGLAFSLSASAGYVRYDLHGPMTGYIIQHTTDQSIAYFRVHLPIEGLRSSDTFVMGLQPEASDGYTTIVDATTRFRSSGPTNFDVQSNFGGDQETEFSLVFSRGLLGIYGYRVDYRSSVYFSDGYQNGGGSHFGLATVGVVRPHIEEEMGFINGYYPGVGIFVPRYIGPSAVPEPESIALLGIGALGLLAARRRKMKTIDRAPAYS